MFGLIGKTSTSPPPASTPPADPLAAARARYTCPNYAPRPGEMRCSHNVGREGEACDLPDYPMCVEWLRLNGQGDAADRILGLVPPARLRARPSAPPAEANPSVCPPTSGVSGVSWVNGANGHPAASAYIGVIPPPPAPAEPDPPPLPPLPGGDLAALFSDEALRELIGTEVDLEFPGLGVVTFLTEHTAEDRLELTWRDVRRLVAIAYIGFRGKAWLRGLRRRRPGAEKEDGDGQY